MSESDISFLLSEIRDQMQDFQCSDCGGFDYFHSWEWDKMSNSEMIERLLPLCKLLNRLFFEYPNCPDTQEIVD